MYSSRIESDGWIVDRPGYLVIAKGCGPHAMGRNQACAWTRADCGCRPLYPFLSGRLTMAPTPAEVLMDTLRVCIDGAEEAVTEPASASPALWNCSLNFGRVWVELRTRCFRAAGDVTRLGRPARRPIAWRGNGNTINHNASIRQWEKRHAIPLVIRRLRQYLHYLRGRKPSGDFSGDVEA